MKKIFLAFMLSCFSLSYAYAQRVNASIDGANAAPSESYLIVDSISGNMQSQDFTPSNTTVITNNNEEPPIPRRLHEVYGTYNTDAKQFGLRYGTIIDNMFYLTGGVGFGSNSYFSGLVGGGYGGLKELGKSGAYISGHLFLYGQYYTMKVYKTVSKFVFGPSADVSIGGQVYRTDDGKIMVVSIGYFLGAPNFEFKDLFKNGSFGLSLTFSI